MPYFRRNGNVIGNPKTITSSSTSGIWDLDNSNKLIQNRQWPGTNVFPVSNAELQWVMSAQDGPSSFTSGTNADLSEGNTQAYTGNWTTSSTLTKTSYTNSSGATRYYYPISNASRLQPVSNTSGNNSIILNGGFTFYFTFIPYASNTGWTRLFNYFGLANGSTTTVEGNTDEFDGPLIFANQGSQRFEYRRPTNVTTANGDHSNPTGNVLTYNTTNALSMVIQQNSNGTANFWLRNKNWSTGSTNNTFDNSSITFLASAGGYGIRSGTNTGLPVFADAYYSAVTFDGIMESGFANRPYTSTECYDLVEHLNTKYG
jgi:hypothetical protein